MPLPLIPLAILGAGSIGGVGAYFGFKNQEPDKKISHIHNNTYKTSNYAFGDNSQLTLYDYLNNTNANAVNQEDTNTSDNTLLYIGLGVGAVALYYWSK